jgi:hypothetical protein
VKFNHAIILVQKKPSLQKEIRDFSPQAIYTDRATAACQRSLVPTFAVVTVVSATNPHGR